MIIDKSDELEIFLDEPMDRTVEPSFIDTEDVQENILRPKYLSDFQGQDELKENLKIYIDAAKNREKPWTIYSFRVLLVWERPHLLPS